MTSIPVGVAITHAGVSSVYGLLTIFHHSLTSWFNNWTKRQESLIFYHSQAELTFNIESFVPASQGWLQDLTSDFIIGISLPMDQPMCYHHQFLRFLLDVVTRAVLALKSATRSGLLDRLSSAYKILGLPISLLYIQDCLNLVLLFTVNYDRRWSWSLSTYQ
ncbi:hypothetical protein PROFUN_12873 [Planoprotostelium fungivorum]|uniref:Uncharacterized protein n=1 Tax=Planoprotostelium fungivorum TaxID=1890364 RepID=A0A2P6N6C5_9EUKA|nr:hypothetical protein PROFUN_12873 [Planoprotostelium fungivorum]